MSRFARDPRGPETGAWRIGACVGAAAFALACFTPTPADDTEVPEPQAVTARVTYVTESTVYVEAGRADGLHEGDRLDVVRDGQTVAVLEVDFLSSHRAACNVVDGSGALEVGDSVRLSSPDDGDETLRNFDAPVPEDQVLHVSAKKARKEDRRARGTRLRGRVGLRYLWIQDRTENGERYSQPALDFRLDGTNLGDGLLDLAVDVRSRQSYTTQADGATDREGRTRVYRAALAVHDRQTRQRLSLGRQFSTSLATLGVFDGIAGDIHRNHWTVGLLSGSQPDPADFSYSTEVREHAFFVQAHNQPGASRRWSLTTGFIGSYQEGLANREFVYVQGLFTGPRFSAYVAEEIDYRRNNLESKIDASNEDISLTSSLINLRYRVGKAFTLRAGYDSRRTIRLYRDVVTPETDLNDAIREGVWVGFSHRFKQRYRMGLDLKTRSGGSSGTADSATMNFGVSRISRANLSFGYRGTYYTNDIVEGWLASLNSGIDLGKRVHLGLTGGVRDDTNLTDPDLGEQLTWYGLDLDLTPGRHWFMQLSVERTEGQLEKNDQAYVSTTYRF